MGPFPPYYIPPAADRMEGEYHSLAMADVDDDDGSRQEFYGELLRAWQNERHAPVLLPFPFAPVLQAIDAIEIQMERMEGELAGPTVEMAFVRCLHQMEIERIRYILQSLFRARLYKIERYWAGLKGMPLDEQVKLMSKAEIDHLRRYNGMMERAMREAVLDALPPPLRALPHQDPDLVPQLPAPSPAAHVIARFREDVGELVIDPVTQTVETGVGRGDVYVVQYQVVGQLLSLGHVELI